MTPHVNAPTVRIEIFSWRTWFGAKRWDARIASLKPGPGDGRVQLTGSRQGYSRKVDARAMAHRVRDELGAADIVEV